MTLATRFWSASGATMVTFTIQRLYPRSPPPPPLIPNPHHRAKENPETRPMPRYPRQFTPFRLHILPMPAIWLRVCCTCRLLALSPDPPTNKTRLVFRPWTSVVVVLLKLLTLVLMFGNHMRSHVTLFTRIPWIDLLCSGHEFV
jgi:hypothetical protein